MEVNVTFHEHPYGTSVTVDSCCVGQIRFSPTNKCWKFAPTLLSLTVETLESIAAKLRELNKGAKTE